MILQNLNIIGQEGMRHLEIAQNRIHNIADEVIIRSGEEMLIDFKGALAFPGLINSHDHLDFDLFPRLGNKIYKSYVEWGADIQVQNKDIIETITRIPKHLRIQWGIYKNLLNGVTTVVNHGEHLNIGDPIIDVFQNCHSLHSVRLERSWKLKLNNPFANKWPFVIHLGEGVDEHSFNEINELIRWNLFNRELIAIHGVAMDPKQAEKFKALIWCPASNYFLLDQTAKINELKERTTILFGTDSTLTAGWNLWDQLRLAKKLNLLSEKEIYNSLTSIPASVWKLEGKGELLNGMYSDIVVTKKNNNDLFESFFQSNPEDILLILKNGKVILFDRSLSDQMNSIKNDFSKISINGITKYAKGDLTALIREIKRNNSEIIFPIAVD